ncbi:PP2C family serine/threonine-protein phosphatase [Streptomyces sp. JJ36]|uniref:PP2C family protein-serine/threonine phosphatase n=1 Tax=Streptomyces sp. JJ36 TaxID=2736645 RepID=UPI001F1C4F35|nr:protein phosphatase 2C domain-containing protein [Streptomyces sp. JJ36]MCF6525052.1 protein phosphatase 2C domain-containing protein [Streptomyces sp. JJ36]
MPQLDRLPACPRCTETPAADARFCADCGADLRAAEEPAGPAGHASAEGAFVAAQGVATDAAAQGVATDTAAQGVATDTPAQGFATDTAAQGVATDTAAQGVATDTPAQGVATAPVAASGAPAGAQPPAAGTDRPEEARERAVRCVACGTGRVDGGYCAHCGHQQPLARDHWEREAPGVAGASDRGLRHHHNEDFFSVAAASLPDGSPASVAVVCDGVSSAARSDEAAEAAAEAAGAALCTALPRGVEARRAMREALLAAAEAVDALATEAERETQQNAPACTIVGTVVAGSDLTVGWVGDSRAYWVPRDRTAPAARLTEDDSWAAQMVAAGLLGEAEAYADARAHAITGWLGADAYELDPHTASFRPEGAGVVVVCTDGLWNYAESAAEMAAAVPADAGERPLHSARHLVGYALDGGGHDNVTVAVVPVPAPADGADGAVRA